MQFAGNESLRKHYMKTDCKRPLETEEDKLSKEPEVKYNCPVGCNFFGPLRLMLTHMYRHPEANVKFRLKKTKLLPVKCEECSFHYTTRSSLSKHHEKKRCEKNKESVKYVEAKIENRRAKRAKQNEEKEKFQKLEIEAIQTPSGPNGLTFLKCPFSCGRMYTSETKLAKHITTTHNAIVQTKDGTEIGSNPKNDEKPQENQ